jgi:predicted transcriptional regulator
MLVEWLNSEFKRRTKKNSRYSLRAFAKSLQMDASTLSAILNNKRKLSIKQASRILDRQNITQDKKLHFLLSELRNFDWSDIKFKELTASQIKDLCDWEYYTVLSLLETTVDFETSEQIAKKINISKRRTEEVLYRLIEMGLVAYENKKFISKTESLSTSHDIPSDDLKRGHRQLLEKAMASLELDSVLDRDITGITMAISKDRLLEAKLLIRDFRRQLSQFLESGTKECVYRLNIQLFPLTKKD